jgi:KDO2-lipid IV(A) lauroyltransferase
VDFLPPHGRELPFKILKALKDQRCVAFVIDQFMGKPYGIESTFFGYKTGSPVGLSVFANKSQAPVVPIHCYRDSEGVFNIVFSPEVPFEKTEQKDNQLLHMSEKYNRVVESLILKHPEQWMWIHRRWKKWE